MDTKHWSTFVKLCNLLFLQHVQKDEYTLRIICTCRFFLEQWKYNHLTKRSTNMYFFVSDIGTVKLLIVYTRMSSRMIMCLRMTDFSVWISTTDGCTCPPLKPHSQRAKAKFFFDVYCVFFDSYQLEGTDPKTSLTVHLHRLRSIQRPRLAPIKFERSN